MSVRNHSSILQCSSWVEIVRNLLTIGSQLGPQGWDLRLEPRIWPSSLKFESQGIERYLVHHWRWIPLIFSRGHATLELAVSVGLSVGWSVTFLICERFRHCCPCPTKHECIFCYTAPAHPSATGGECIRPCLYWSLFYNWRSSQAMVCSLQPEKIEWVYPMTHDKDTFSSKKNHFHRKWPIVMLLGRGSSERSYWSIWVGALLKAEIAH